MKHSRQALLKAKENLIGYLLQKAESEDWHGCADAAMDLREVDAKIEMLNEIESTWKLPTESSLTHESLYDSKTDRYLFANGTPDPSKDDLRMANRIG